MTEPLTIGKLLLKHSVPDHLKPYVNDTILDKKGIGGLFSKLSEGDDNVYKKAVSNLARLGFETSTRMGSTVPLADLKPLDDKEERFKKLESDLDKINKESGTKKEKDIKKIELYSKFTKDVEDALITAGTSKNHTLVKVIKAGARGTMQQYRQTVGSPILVTDEKGKPMLDFPIKNSFADGLSVPEYLLHSYGIRQGTIGTKLSVADSGYFSKQLSRAATPLVIEEHDCGTNNGLPAATSDRDSMGTFLAHAAGKFNRNNMVTPKMLSELSNEGIKEIIIRSPITCQASRKSHNGAICQMCAGKREKGPLPALGSYLGITAATALGEPLAQGQLNSKHSAGSASLGKTVATGFKLIDQLANIPHTFQNKAAVANADGTIKTVRKLPQGGTEIIIGSHKGDHTHYVSAGFEPTVKLHDHVEAGDVMSEGIVNPAEIVEHKGIGEGRNYFVKAMHKAFDESGMGVNRRNFEVIARGAIDHVRITHPEGLGEHLPDAVVSYQAIEKDYKPRSDAKLSRVDLAKGKYLEEPALHYTIGTRLTSKMVDNLKKHKIDAIHVHDEPPPFHPEMVRLLDVPGHIPDWAHQLYSTYLEKRLINAVNTGMTSSLKGPSPVLGLSYGVGFGQKRAEDEDIT
jgi:DNA-directed RNA polymerase subunit beta'